MSGGNQERSGLREDRWLENQRDLADGIVTDEKRFCPDCVKAIS